jgi:hypothetical protein
LESIPEGVLSSFPNFTAATLSYAAEAVQLQKHSPTGFLPAFATALPPLRLSKTKNVRHKGRTFYDLNALN